MTRETRPARAEVLGGGELPRRAFLIGGACTVAFAGLAWPGHGRPRDEVGATASGPAATRLTSEDFLDLVGEHVPVLQPGRRALSLRVDAVIEHPVDASWPFAHRPYSVLLRPATGPTLSQDVYRIAHPTCGSHDLLLVPVVTDDGSPLYEAVFS